MKKILVTGSTGFIGKHLCSKLAENDSYQILEFNKTDTKKELEEYIIQADYIFHLAAVMRPEVSSDFSDVNIKLTSNITKLLEQNNKSTPLAISSSVQAELNNEYGLSKKMQEIIVRNWAKRNGAKIYVYRLPNVFGKWAKPNYTSVVATFCYNISHDIDIEVHEPKKTIKLAYIDDVINEFIKNIDNNIPAVNNGFFSIERTFSVTIQELADTIKSFKNISYNYDNAKNDLEKLLYCTYKSYERNLI